MRAAFLLRVVVAAVYTIRPLLLLPDLDLLDELEPMDPSSLFKAASTSTSAFPFGAAIAISVVDAPWQDNEDGVNVNDVDDVVDDVVDDDDDVDDVPLLYGTVRYGTDETTTIAAIGSRLYGIIWISLKQ